MPTSLRARSQTEPFASARPMSCQVAAGQEVTAPQKHSTGPAWLPPGVLSQHCGAPAQLNASPGPAFSRLAEAPSLTNGHLGPFICRYLVIVAARWSGSAFCATPKRTDELSGLSGILMDFCIGVVGLGYWIIIRLYFHCTSNKCRATTCHHHPTTIE